MEVIVQGSQALLQLLLHNPPQLPLLYADELLLMAVRRVGHSVHELLLISLPFSLPLPLDAQLDAVNFILKFCKFLLIFSTDVDYFFLRL